VAIDSTANISSRIPILIAAVVLLSMLLLLVAFRSIAVAVKAAVMNLLSVAAAYGVVALVLQGGWAGQLIGIGMAAAILIDATVIRMLLVPAVMHLLGDRNWWLPARLDRALPEVHIEGHPQHYQPTSAPADADQAPAAAQLTSV